MRPIIVIVAEAVQLQTCIDDTLHEVVVKKPGAYCSLDTLLTVSLLGTPDSVISAWHRQKWMFKFEGP